MTPDRRFATGRAEDFPTTLCYRVARVSRQAFYDWQTRSPTGSTEREAAEPALVVNIRAIHEASGAIHGSPHVTAQLRGEGHRVNIKRVATLIRAHHIGGVRPRWIKRATTHALST